MSDLKKTSKEIEAEIMKFPLTMKTMAIRKRKEDLEHQMDKINSNIATFSKEVVYVGI